MISNLLKIFDYLVFVTFPSTPRLKNI